MSDDQRVLTHPHSTIGVQDLISFNSSKHSGFLRKKGRLERIAERIKIVKPFVPSVAKWRQRYVVLSRGCIYIFLDEFSSSPFQAYSLNGYIRVIRYNSPDGRERWSFEIEPDDITVNKILIFGCATEDERKEWMNALREQMILANDVRPEETTVAVEVKGRYSYLENYVKQPLPKQSATSPTSQASSAKKKSPLPAVPDSDSEEDSDDDDNSDYDEIPEEDLPKARPPNSKLPPTPNEMAANNSKPEVKDKKPAKAPKPKQVLAKRITRMDFEFKGSDRKQMEEVLNTKPPGTFLVRKSRQDEREVLSVKTDEGIKEYKIYNHPENGFSIDNKDHFNSVEELIEHYMKNQLPNRTMTLSRGFSMQDANT